MVEVSDPEAGGESPAARVAHDMVTAPGGAVVVIVVAGEIDMRTDVLLSQELVVLDLPEPVPVVVDLSEVSFLGSSGIAALARAHSAARRRGLGYALITVPGSVADRALRLMGMNHILSLYPDRRAAIKAVLDGSD